MRQRDYKKRKHLKKHTYLRSWETWLELEFDYRNWSQGIRKGQKS